jgi:hypothetical protein
VIRKLIIGNGRTERELVVVGNLLIGRDPACHVSEPDPLLSRRHAEILCSVHGVSVRDLDSRNGVLVNGEKTREQVLFSGDVVQMGHLQLRYVEESSVTEPAHNNDRRATDHPSGSIPFDRFRHDPTPRPGRRKEPTPLPGRPNSPRVQNFTPVPRGRAPFDQRSPSGDSEKQPGARSVIVHPSSVPDPEIDPVELEATLLAPVPGSDGPFIERRADRRRSQNPDGTAGPGDATFAAALAQLSGSAGVGPEVAGPIARLTANADLTVIEATPACAELLGIPGERLVGDSLPDVFLRGVRRAYSEPGTMLSLHVARSTGGSITVFFTLGKADGSAK